MIVDRIEGSLAVVEVAKGTMRDIPLDRIRGRVRDGAVLVADEDGLVVDENETSRRAKQAQSRLDALFGKGDAEQG